MLHRICRLWFETRGEAEFHLHDPLALAVAVDPSLVEVEKVAVIVDLDEANRGRTRPVGPGAVGVARVVDAARFARLFRDVLGFPEPRGA
jgi:inosine-uridine nucleoside N-ribohydrolase